jgi:Holliday junction resolvasome RuvABC endonuclease subunit
MIIGLDISTSITGITILDKEGNRLYTGVSDSRKCKDFFEKVEKQTNDLFEILSGYDVGDFEGCYIEQSLQAFRPGLSSAKTLLALAGMNKTLSWEFYRRLGIKPEYIGATTARKLNGITVPRGEKAKAVVLKFVVDTEIDFVVEYTKFGNPKTHHYDEADSIVIARAGLNLWKKQKSSES